MSGIVLLRHQNLRKGIDFRSVRCLEIGALSSPVIHREEGEVLYADHLSTEGLKKQFAWDPGLDPESLVHVDVVWQEKRLRDCVSGTFDYVFASHVAEHVPNLVGWMEEIREVLKPQGELRLVIPDARYSFDMNRQLTRLADLMAAWMKNLRYPDTSMVLDFALNKITDSEVDLPALFTGPLKGKDLHAQFPFSEVLMWGQRTLNPHHYEDVHCWVLTPRHFAQLMIPLAENNILHLACADFVDSDPPGFEFILHLTPEENKEKLVASWKTLLEKAKDPIPGSFAEKEHLAQQEVQNTFQHIKAENAMLHHQLQAILNSTSWRITAPLRAIIQKFRKE
ncbi:methyltransferase domain-containing protein [Entomobacter blattae]|uniref:Methyltransferase type 11 domain-containing protein n=1 Tax=Entomobacter blattae TaxID=2762277 RepID=A0A7H1NPC4_9PROT|nr:class I SAM-dependent methyltransferase [Entomobacter blattae]QNT77634.1 hypothetical protein JGUZn3_03830 [Entomobacter blattae]